MASTVLDPATSRTLFVLGAKDPEMKLIREVLEFLAFEWIPATRAGKRVYPGNAYAADPPPLDAAAFATVHAVECGWSHEAANVTHIDHHHPGDPGYGKPPAEYFAAASIGQIFALAAHELPAHGQQARLAALHARYDHVAHLAAAADHCLGAAYRGQCPGVDPGELTQWIIERRAAFLHMSPDALRARVEASCVRIRALAVDGLADLRGEPGSTVPEAPHAACIAGIAVLTEVVDRDGRHKVGLLGASAAQVARFLAGELVPGLTGFYGDPARGFAGGYRPRADR
ncbi:MAG: hypothetical protein EPN56_05175 [Rhodanobacter sp.]|nr:MAG: hypothetical protein EPN78_01640 [Rhodanobacter sp.]TAM15160.1 MAG: hypothetical protein EPN66_01010 [Rhodanobacter sp.]TAM36370.1 MAG: hypothetical protein EPN56_05175 [Rhodanobacter sp.]